MKQKEITVIGGKLTEEHKRALEASRYRRALADSVLRSQASSGYYLDRAIAIAFAFGLSTDARLLLAFKTYMEESAKPAGLDAFLYTVSHAVICLTRRAGLADCELEPIAWGLDYQAMRDAGIDIGALRRAGMDAERSDK